MPGLNRTGPDGQGPMTGRGFGSCTAYSNPGFMNYFFARGMGRGRGLGFGRGRGFIGHNYPYGNLPYSNLNKEEKLNMLQAQVKSFEKGLREIQKRIDELEESKEKEYQYSKFLEY